MPKTRLSPPTKEILLFAIFSFFVLSIPYYGVTSCYGFQDDYNMLFNADAFWLQVWNDSVGRPIYGDVIYTLWPLANSVCDLTLFRIASFIGVHFFTIMLFWTFRFAGWPLSIGGATSLLIVLTPPFSVYVAWATTFHIPFSVILAFGSAHILLNKIPEKEGQTYRPRTVRVFLSVFVLFCAAALYQSSIPFFLLYAAIVLLFSNRALKNSIPKLYYVLGVFIGTNVLYLVSFKLAVWPFELSAELEKSRFAVDYLDKMTWFGRAFWDYALPLHGTLLFPGHFNWVGLFVGALVVTGLARYLQHQPRRRAALILIVLVLGPVSFYPSLLAQDPYISFRTQACLSALLVIYLMLNLLYERSMHTRVVSSVILLLVAVSLTFYNVNEGLVRPNRQEYNALAAEIRQSLQAGHRQMTFIMPNLAYSPFGYVKGEYGLLASHHDWTPEPLAQLLAREISGIDPSAIRVQAVRESERANLSPGIVLIDGKKIISDSIFVESFR